MGALSWFRFAPREDPLRVTGHAEPILSIDHEGWLCGPMVKRVPSVRHYQQEIAPKGIVWHATSCPPGTKLWERIRTYDREKDRSASWHALVETDGTIYQSVPFNRGAWHCRVTPDSDRILGAAPNLCTAGIELAATEACERPGYQWPARQRLSGLLVRDALVDHYYIQGRLDRIAHSSLDPERRGDPGDDWMKILEDAP